MNRDEGEEEEGSSFAHSLAYTSMMEALDKLLYSIFFSVVVVVFFHMLRARARMHRLYLYSRGKNIEFEFYSMFVQ